MLRSFSAPCKVKLTALTCGVIKAVPRLSAFCADSSVSSIDWARPKMVNSTLEVSTNEVEIAPADWEAPTSVPEVFPSDPDVLISDWEVSVNEASTLCAELRIDCNDVVVSAT